nr:hypothetical protein [Tanacetum cinerariifolium]
LDSEGNPTTATQKVRETYKTVTQEIRDQLNVEAEAVQIILTGIDNDIYSTVDACLNACDMWKAIERLKQCESINEKAGIQLNAEQADWKDDTNDESDEQELEAHYMYMAKLQQVSPDVVDSGPIFDKEPEQKVQNDDHYDVFAIECQHPEQSESVHKTYLIEKDAHNVIIESKDMNYDSEQIDQNDEDADLAEEQLKRRDSIEYASKMELDCAKVRDTISVLKQQKDAQIKLYKSREDKEIKKVIDLENKVKVLDYIVYKTSQTVQTMNMLNNKCRTSFVKPEYLKKAKQANPRLYDIRCYNDNIALMLTAESDEVIRLEKESRSKLSDLIRPFDYEKSSEQRFF